MKIKVAAEDFLVREESDLEIASEPQSQMIFRLVKQDWDTFDLLDLLARRHNIRKQDISVAGIKDRHGRTEQLVSIRYRQGFDASIADPPPEDNFTLTFLGFAAAPITAKDIRGNRFTITIRDIASRNLKRCLANAEIVGRWGVPNYYDEQRFGSARHGKGFMGKEIFRGKREKALRLYFEPSKFDNRKTRVLKSCVVENWGNWECCIEEAFGEYRRILEYLSVHKQAFHRALSLIDRRFLVFVLNAYQSFLFNQILSDYLAGLKGKHGLILDRHPYSRGQFLFYRDLPEPLFEELRSISLPVPGWDSHIGNPAIADVTTRVLEREQIELRDLKVRQMSRIYINGTQRPAILLPEDFSVESIAEDELYKDKKKMTLKFFLPRGGYATLILKRLEARLEGIR
jgi:tRNA pseudouridine13 synthase